MDPERPLIKVLLMAASGRRRELAAQLVCSHQFNWSDLF
jgi:hypothetical protein